MARTTRLNISVPVSLQERLKRDKGKLNVSKICVAALERELERQEAAPSVPPPLLEKLVARLQNNHERWSERGRRDAERWAVEVAQRDELRRVGDTPTSKGDGAAPVIEIPSSFDLAAAVDAWVRRDAGIKEDDVHRFGENGRRPPRFPPPMEEALQRARAQVDETAYRSGWAGAVRDIWRAVRPALQ